MRKLNKGCLIISLDTEIGLGHLADNEIKKFDVQFLKAKDVTKRLIGLFNKYKISATWAIVGKLIEKEKIIDIEHFYPLDNITEEYIMTNNDIYRYESLVKLLSESETYQEIASHSYSHITFKEGNRKHHANKNLANDDFNAVIKCFHEYNLRPKSFVYPQNRPGFEELLPDFGFNIYRGKEVKWYHGLPKTILKIAKGLDNLTPIPPCVSLPTFKSPNLIETNGHLHFAKLPSGYRRLMPWWVLKLKLYFGLKKAIYLKKTFHLWTHPYDLVFQEQKHFKVLEWFFKKVNKYQSSEKLIILTMGDLTNKS
jgi:peptidoglycan/xylan/chitin deacetylase (PgdA/CDA1 family)